MASAGTPAEANEAQGPIPLRYGDDPHVWACWLYYEDGMTQGDIARTMGISRATVNTYLADARARGIVTITLDPARLGSLSIARELKRHFGLKDCLVVPGDDGTHPLIDRLGQAGAQAMRKLITSGDRLAVVSGRTVLAVAERTRIAGLQDVVVVQATGGTAASADYTPDLCAGAFARALDGRCVTLLAPAIVRAPEVKQILLAEPLLASHFTLLAEANRIVFGIASLRANSTIRLGGAPDAATIQAYRTRGAVGFIAGQFIDERGRSVAGPLDGRTIGITLDALDAIPTRIAVAGGLDKVPAILAALRGGHVSVLITDAATGRGILKADGVSETGTRSGIRPRPEVGPGMARGPTKKFLNDPRDVVEEMLAGAVKAHAAHIRPIGGSHRALVAVEGPRPGKVGLVIGGGSGHEPCFLGYVGRGLADAVAIGNVFSSPPPDPIVACAQAASGGAGVLFVYGNYTGDVMNFEMAAEMTVADGIAVRTVLTTDDIASSPHADRDGRRGVAGNLFMFKVAGAACDRGLDLDACATVTAKANARTFTVGIGLEACSLPQTRKPSFDIGAGDIEVGIGIHGEPGIAREALQAADAIADTVIDRIFTEMTATAGDRVAVLVNSFGATPMMELYILYRRVEQRLSAKGIVIAANWIGPYCTSLDMAGASISLLHLDAELETLLAHPCDTVALRVG